MRTSPTCACLHAEHPPRRHGSFRCKLCLPQLWVCLSISSRRTPPSRPTTILHQFGQLYIDHEGAVRSAFQDLLAKCGRKAKPPLTLVPQYRIERARSSVIVDGALVDLYHLPHGYWEAKDEKDDLAREVERKLDKGYPRDNIIFQAPERAILYQSGARIFDENITRPEALPATATAPSRSGTSSITSTPFCTIPSIASATRRTYAASCPAFRSSALPQGLKPRWKGRPTRR